jgi:hypothetical protein
MVKTSYKPPDEMLAEAENNGWNTTAVSYQDTRNEPSLLEDVVPHEMENPQNEPTTESLITEFNTFGKVISEHVVLRSRTVSRAKAKGKNGFEEFCMGAHLDPASSTTRKYALIGAEADWLLPLAPRLPPDWTTIYYVVTLGQVKAQEMAQLGILHPQVTAKQLKAAAIADLSNDVAPDPDVGNETAATVEPCILEVDATDLPDQDRLNLYQDLREAAAQHGLTVTGLPERLDEELITELEAA